MLLQMIGTLDFSRGRFSSYLHVPKIYLLNLLPVALLVAFTYFATNRAWLGFLIPSVLLFVMDFVNYFKVTLRGDPFVAEDFLTIGEGAGIIGQYTLHFPAMFFVGIALIAAGTIVLHRWARGRMPKKRWWLRVLALVLIVLLGFGAWELWYGNTDLYDSMMEANTSLFNVWKDAENYASKGFVYSFLNSLAEAMPQKPDGYSARKAEDLLSAYPEADIPEGQRVNVIATMLESFSDLSMFDSVSERFVQDPYADFHALQAESYTGTLISDTIGGGTINAERAFLTGYSYPQPRYRRDTESFVRYFLEQGYETEGGHPGYAWFYSREKINERLGFETYHFLDDYYENLLTDENSLDGHPNDEAFFAERAESWEARDPSKPCFSFSVSYQGHSPYADDTLVWGETYIPHEGISDAAYYTVNNYLGSVASTGKQLAAYVDSTPSRSCSCSSATTSRRSAQATASMRSWVSTCRRERQRASTTCIPRRISSGPTMLQRLCLEEATLAPARPSRRAISCPCSLTAAAGKARPGCSSSGRPVRCCPSCRAAACILSRRAAHRLPHRASPC